MELILQIIVGLRNYGWLERINFSLEEENKDLSNKLDLNDESDYEQELTEQERENNTFKTILRSLGKHDVIIDKFMELDDYVRYCDCMNKVNLKPVTAIDFNLGFKYKSK